MHRAVQGVSGNTLWHAQSLGLVLAGSTSRKRYKDGNQDLRFSSIFVFKKSKSNLLIVNFLNKKL